MTDGLLVIDKPTGMTSHDVVAICRKVVGQKRIGHAGTLDPGATGVLLVGMGRATRLMRYVSELPKSYKGQIVLGRSTTTLDGDGDTVAIWDMTSTTLLDVQIAGAKFVGDIQQVPPMVSAIKIKGQRLHELARAGIEIERDARNVTIHRIDIGPTDEPGVFDIEVDCSPGTYIRTLVADIGEALGGGAHLRNLRRTAIGHFSVDTAFDLDRLRDDWQACMLAPSAMVSHLASARVDSATATAISHGKPLDGESLGLQGDGPWAVLNGEGDLLGVYQAGKSAIKAAVVLAAS